MNFSLDETQAIEIASIQVANGRTKFQVDGKDIDINEKMREIIRSKAGDATEWDAYSYDESQIAIFRLLTKVITKSTSMYTKEAFNDVMDWKDTKLGDRIDFKVLDEKTFKVSKVANGTNTLQRQQVSNGKAVSTSFMLGVKTYMDFIDFMLDKIDWKRYVEKVGLSFKAAVATEVATAFADAYNGVTGEYKVDATGGFDDSLLIKLCTTVGGKVNIYGTKSALAKVPAMDFADDQKDVRNKGYVAKWKGYDCIELENPRMNGATALPDDKLFIMPADEKIIYGGFEGDLFVNESNNQRNRVDQQIEYSLMRRMHLGVKETSEFGLYEM